jgi:formiminoglutamase
MSNHLVYQSYDEVESYKLRREHEQRVADVIHVPDASRSLEHNLAAAHKNQVKFIIVGVPEDIGPRANCGFGGALNAWMHFLPVLLTQQQNEFFDWSQVMLLGTVKVDDLLKMSHLATMSDHRLSSLRDLCSQLDERVSDVLSPLFAADFKVIVIGGGHNNAYPIIKSLAQTSKKQVSCVNLDPHADFRATEGRHSGNPFRYAYKNEFLSHYFVLGLHEQKNNVETLTGLKEAGFPYITYQQLFVEHSVDFYEAVNLAKGYVDNSDEYTGIEVDLDSVKHVSASAYSAVGFSIEQALHYVYQLAKMPKAQYLHLCEAAPDDNEPSNHKALEVGQILTQMTYSFVTGATAPSKP